MAVFMFPGQGSQKVGMGKGLFEEFPKLTAAADALLGYSIEDLCLNDPDGKIGQTQYTQPALYVVNCLTYQKKLQESGKPSYFVGHSLGEYAALYAAGSFDFETGLMLVKKRGEIMSQASGGGMAAIIGLLPTQIIEILEANQLDAIDMANFNTMTQIVISGNKDDIIRAKPIFESAGCRMFIPLNVSGAFHSRYMTPARNEFKSCIDQFILKTPEVPIIANLTAKPYIAGEEKDNLIEQINHSVKWTESIQYLLEKGEQEFIEIGPGNVLAGTVAKIKRGQ